MLVEGESGGRAVPAFWDPLSRWREEDRPTGSLCKSGGSTFKCLAVPQSSPAPQSSFGSYLGFIKH